MKPTDPWQRLVPAAAETYEVRWIHPTHRRGDVLVRRFRREGDATRFAQKLLDQGFTHVRVFKAPVGRWRELHLDRGDHVDDLHSWGW